MSEHIGSLVDAGIDSFKIEGRMKRHEYVAGVVRIYRNLIERYFEEPEGFQVSETEKYTLLQLFNRGFTTGYFFGNPGSELMSRKFPYNIGTEIGTVAGYDSRKKVLSLCLKATLRVGDGIGTGGVGVTVRSMYLNNQRVSAASSGLVKIPFDIEVDKGSTVFKTYDSRLMSSLETKSIRKIPIKISIKSRIGEPVELCINDGENEIMVHGGIVSRAESKPMLKDSVEAQLKKLGNTVFEAQEISFETNGNIFIPVSELNELRRRAVSELETERAQKWKRGCRKPEMITERRNIEIKPILAVSTNTIEGFEAAVDNGADVVYIGGEVFENTKPQINADERRFIEKEDYSYAIEYGRKKGVSVFIGTPRIIKEIKDINKDFNHLSPDGYLVANLGVLYYLHKQDTNKPIVIDYPFNVFNRLTMDYLLNYSQRVTLSPELTLKEIKNLTPFGQTECIVHGFFPLMVSEHGLVSSLFSNGRDSGLVLKDEKGFSFPIKTDTQNRTYVMNSRELCTLEYVPDIVKAGVGGLRIEAKTYDKDKTGEITRAYREAIDNSIAGKKIGKSCSGEYTTGHYYRGAA
jgi:putative protease